MGKGTWTPSKRVEIGMAGAALLFFLWITCRRLTATSLWFDEAVEYWYSKVMFGPLPFEDSGNMYQRIVSTLQPPLYNILLYFWLKLHNTVWWFRFFGVVVGVLGMLGIYDAVKRTTGKAVLATGAVCFAACLYQTRYYWREASEYCLMMGALCGTICLWFRLMDRPTRKHILLFTLFAVISVYSQYGAAFPVMGLTLTALWGVRKNRRATLELSASYLLALTAAALPLYLLFLRKQIPLQHGDPMPLSFENGIVRDCLINLHTVFRWTLTNYGASSKFLLVGALLVSAAVLVWGSGLARTFLVANVITWFSYYFAVKRGLYANMTAYGGFGNRYNLFLIPLWVVYAFVAGMECYRIIQRFLSKYRLQQVYAVLAVCCAVWIGVSGLREITREHGSLENIRDAVAAWYDADGAAEHTLVYYAAAPGFCCYARLDPRYTEETEERVTYMPWYQSRSGEEYRAYLDSLYGETWPDTVYIAASHIAEDLDTIEGEFVRAGYQSESLFDREDGRLTAFTRLPHGV